MRLCPYQHGVIVVGLEKKRVRSMVDQRCPLDWRTGGGRWSLRGPARPSPDFLKDGAPI